MAAVSEQAKKKAKEQAKRYRQENREKVREINARNNAARCAAYRKRNQAKFLASQQAYYQRNRDSILSYLKQYRDTSNSHARSNKAWSEANKGTLRAINAKRRATIRRAIPLWANPAAIKVFYDQAVALTRETGIPYVVDHIIPLTSALVCGLHWEGNLQVITARANGEKHNKLLPM